MQSTTPLRPPLAPPAVDVDAPALGRVTHCRYLEVFGPAASAEIYQMALTKREVFSPSRTSPSRHYPDWRRSTVVYDEQLRGVYDLLQAAVLQRLASALVALGVAPFDIDGIELQLTSHNDGEYYRWHTDNGTAATAARAITFVYYFHCLPKRFSGGELILYGDDGTVQTIEPQHDSLVLFSSHRRHEVMPVSCPSRRFEDARFTLNGWVRRCMPRHIPDHFGYWIFSPPAPKRALQPTFAAAAPARHVDEDDKGVLARHRQALQKLYSDLHRNSRRAATIDVRTTITPAQFFDDYYAANRPLLISGGLRQSPAVQTWSPEFLRQHYGAVPVQVTAGRERDRDYERHFRQSVTRVTVAEFVERALAGPSNDTYLVARNYFFDHPALRPLRAQIQPPPQIVNVDDERPGTVKFWFGPAGTVTPLHYDEHSILLAQIYGRKKFLFVPPFDTDKLYPRHRFYSAVDPEWPDLKRYPAFAQASVAAVEVAPGDLLFIPVAWWHWARALSVSMSATFCSFCVAGGNTSFDAMLSTCDS
ncbi:MAG TPA: cupin-like domain-containing protein [Burkholderiales bacterium]|nr:cupin-like domain-containing protein [Burkholderiales bacterium]